MKYLFILFLLLFTLTADDIKVVLQLKWKHQFQFAGYYMAKEKGFYKDAGLNVDIKEFNSGDDVVKEVMSGDVDFAIANTSTLLYNANQGLDLLFLLAAYQTSPSVLIADKNITNICDFKHKTIMFNESEVDTASINAMLYSNGITKEDYKRVKNDFNVDELATHKVDAIMGYISNEPYLLRKAGIKVHIFDPKDYGYSFYDDLLFTSSRYAQKYPQRVSAFYEASMKGWQYAFANIDETADVIMKKYNTQAKTKDAYLYEAKVLKKLAYTDGVAFGNISHENFNKILEIYDKLGYLYKNHASLDNSIYVPKETEKESFSDLELNYIHKKHSVSMCVNPDWMPFEAIKDGHYIGMGSDYIDWIKTKTGLNIVLIPTKNFAESLELIKQKKCDMTPFVIKTEANKGYMNFTSPVIETRLSFVTKSDKLFINDTAKLNGKKIGVVKGSGFKSKIELKYPKIELVEIKDLKEGLDMVLDNELYGVMDLTSRLNYRIDGSKILKISGQFEDIEYLPIGVRDDDFMLFSILNKTVEQISDKEKIDIYNRWNKTEQNEFDKEKIFYNITALFIFFILLLFFISVRLNFKLKRKSDEYSQMLNTFDNNVTAMIVDLDGFIVYASKAFVQMSGYSEKELIGSKFLRFMTNGNDLEIFENIMDAIIQGKSYKAEFQNVKKNNEHYWTEVLFSPEVIGINLVGFNAIMQDITLKKDFENLNKNLEKIVQARTQELVYKNNEIEQILDTTMEGILIFYNSVCINANRSALKIGGYTSKDDLIGHFMAEFVTDEYKAIVNSHIGQNYPKPYEVVGIKKDGSTFPCLVKGNTFEINGRFLHITTFIDLTDIKDKEYQLIQVQKELQEQAHKDYLTGLYNRRYFAELAQNYMELFHREKKEASVMMLDIDLFKNINDTYGHGEGDKVIKTLVDALIKNTRQSDIIARFGGEEFVVLLPNIDKKDALHVAQKIRHYVEGLEVVTLQNEVMRFTVSIGISDIKYDDENIETPIKRADDALYKAKNSGRNRVEISD